MISGLFCGATALAAPYPTVEQLRQAVLEVSATVKSEKLDVEILDAVKEGVNLPLMAAGLRLGDSICVVYVSAKPEPRLRPFFEAMPAQDLPIWLNSIAIHEITHCIEQRAAYIHRHFDLVLPPGLPRHNVTVQGYLSVVKSGKVENWGEALADIASVLYLKQSVPERWQYFAHSLVAFRSNMADQWPEHDTSAWLNKVIANGAHKPAEQSLFEAAFQMRLQYRP